MKSSENQTQSQDTAAPASPARLSSPGRRRLLRAGAIGAPALLALKSTPVFATTNCKQPSGFTVSGNASHNAGKSCVSALPPSSWVNNCDQSGCYSGTTCKPAHMYSSLSLSCKVYSDKQLSSCLTQGNGNAQALALACYLQACNPNMQFPTKATIQNIWNQGVCGAGYPVPGTTVTWGSKQCIQYFQYLTGQTITL